VSALANGDGTAVSLQSAAHFSIVESAFTGGSGGGGGSLIGSTPGSQVTGNALDLVHVAFTPFTGSAQESLTFSVNGTDYAFTLNSTNASTATVAANYMISQASGDLWAWDNGDGTIGFENTTYPWILTEDSYNAGGGSPGTGSLFGATGSVSVNAPTGGSGATGNAQHAIAAINAAVAALGAVQGTVGAGENKLNYAIALAQSQIANFSAAQSQIRDADVAASAANLTKAQVLQQTSIAAMAQANSSPQAVLKLLQ
jgi:flagellin